MEHYRIYLRAELGKFKDHRDAAAFLRVAPQLALQPLGLGGESGTLAARFASQEKVDSFVKSLDGPNLVALTELCALWRNNGVDKRLALSKIWMTRQAPIDFVDVLQAEEELGYIFQRHRFGLKAICADTELWTKHPYVGWDHAAVIPVTTLLGTLKSGRYTIFDGIHRALHLCRQGAKAVEVCCCEPP